MSATPPRRVPLPEAHGDNPFAARAKMLWHLDRLAQWRLDGDTFPVLVEVNLINRCNQSCPWCISAYSHSSDARGLEIASLDRFLGQAAVKGLKAVTWSGGGEPTSHPEFLSAVRSAAVHGLEQGLMTNGLFKPNYVPVLGATLKWVRVSLDTLDAERYEQQKRSRGFDQVVANIRALTGRSLKVGVNLNLADWNLDQILPLAHWCRDEGVNYFQIRPTLGLPFEVAHNAAYRTQPTFDWPRLEPLLREAESLSAGDYRVLVSWDKFQDVRDAGGNFGRTYRKCLAHFFACVLNADGDLCVCMYHLGDRRFSFGNIREQSVEEIWNGERRRSVVAMCCENLDLATCQVCCKGHEINKFLHFIENPDPGADVNFL